VPALHEWDPEGDQEDAALTLCFWIFAAQSHGYALL
jgi:hypothetical protein